VLISNELLEFCASKVGEIVADYRNAFPEDANKLPRDPDLLHQVIHGRCEKFIFHKELDEIASSNSTVRSTYVPYKDRVEIYYVRGLDEPHLRFYKTKELFQIHLSRDDMRTKDPVELVANMIVRSTLASVDLDLGHATISETLGDLAAQEFLFPLHKRVAYLATNPDENGVVELAKTHGIPPFIVQQCFNNIEILSRFFPKSEELT
jgi:hypothetical protein